MAALNTSELLFEEKQLYQPPLEELREGLYSGELSKIHSILIWWSPLLSIFNICLCLWPLISMTQQQQLWQKESNKKAFTHFSKYVFSFYLFSIQLPVEVYSLIFWEIDFLISFWQSFTPSTLALIEALFVCTVIQSTLVKNFANVTVEVTDCPDLKTPQYGLMDSGMYKIECTENI